MKLNITDEIAVLTGIYMINALGFNINKAAQNGRLHNAIPEE